MRDFLSQTTRESVQMFAGIVCLFVGAPRYARHGGELSLLVTILGAVFLTLANVTIGVRRVIKEELGREQ